MPKLILFSETLNQLIFNSLITKEAELWEIVRSHHVELVVQSKENSVLQWKIVGPIALDELCDLISDIGYKGIFLATLQKMRSPDPTLSDLWYL